MDKVCRLCARHSSCLESAFSFENDRLLSDLISIVCPIRIDYGDELPKKVCDECKETVIASIHLRESSIKSDILFKSGTFSSISERGEDIKSAREQIMSIKQENFNEFKFVNEEETNFSDHFEQGIVTFAEEFSPPPEQSEEEKPRKKRNQKKKSSPPKRNSLAIRPSLSVTKPIPSKRRSHGSGPPPTNTDTTDLFCAQCNKAFHNTANYRRHHREVHLQEFYRPYKCSICGEEYWSKRLVDTHVHNVHPFVKPPHFKCFLCDFTAEHKFTLEKHMVQRHVVKEEPLLRSKDEPIFCPICLKDFTEVGNCRRHIKSVHKTVIPMSRHILSELDLRSKKMIENLKCYKCRVTFNDQEELREHLLLHSLKSRKSSLKKTYRCETCDENFETQMLYKEHMNSDHKFLLYDCYHFPCRVRMPSALLFRKHLKKHKKIVPNSDGLYSCKVPGCTSVYGECANLRRHVLTNHYSEKEKADRVKNEEEFKCSKCDKTFSSKRNLDYHEAKHEINDA